MDVLLDNPLAKMYGPYFLILYGFVTLFTILFYALLRSRIDKSGRMPLPPIPSVIDPYEIAYLRGGLNEMARTAIFSLTQKGLIEIKVQGKRSLITRTAFQGRTETTTLEDTALGWFGFTRDTSEVFAKDGLVTLIEPYADDYRRRLGRLQLITDTDMKARLALWKWPALALVLGLGFYKGVAAVMHGHLNVIGLIIIAVIGVVGIAVLSRLPWLTELGKQYLERLQLVFERLRYNDPATAPQYANTVHQQVGAGGAMFDPMLLSVGLFGSAVLVGTAYGAHYDAFEKANRQQAGSSCGAGCGSSCSSGGSSCSSGSSCGSSGCGGGGCGGCS